LMDFIL